MNDLWFWEEMTHIRTRELRQEAATLRSFRSSNDGQRANRRRPIHTDLLAYFQSLARMRLRLPARRVQHDHAK